MWCTDKFPVSLYAFCFQSLTILSMVLYFFIVYFFCCCYFFLPFYLPHHISVEPPGPPGAKRISSHSAEFELTTAFFRCIWMSALSSHQTQLPYCLNRTTGVVKTLTGCVCRRDFGEYLNQVTTAGLKLITSIAKCAEMQMLRTECILENKSNMIGTNDKRILM